MWKEQAPSAVFAGKTLADLETAIAAHTGANLEVDKASKALSAALKTRGDENTALNELLQVIVRGVAGHADYGDNSPLYRAMGFIPRSERASGLTRKGTKANPPEADAA